jgi:flagellar basal-body rod protein FlgG
VQIGQDGIVTALIPGQQQPQQLGQIQLVRFTNAAGLAPKGQNLFVQTGASGAPTLSQPGLNGTGTLQGGYLEQSNVAVVEEMVNLITAQRAYEANSKAIVTADEMLQTAVQTKR